MFMKPVAKVLSSAKSTRPASQLVKVNVSVPIGVFFASVGLKFGRKRAPCVRTTFTVAVLPFCGPVPPNHAWAPAGSNVNHHASSVPFGSDSRNRPWPDWAGSYQTPV